MPATKPNKLNLFVDRLSQRLCLLRKCLALRVCGRVVGLLYYVNGPYQLLRQSRNTSTTCIPCPYTLSLTPANIHTAAAMELDAAAAAVAAARAAVSVLRCFLSSTCALFTSDTSCTTCVSKCVTETAPEQWAEDSLGEWERRACRPTDA